MAPRKKKADPVAINVAQQNEHYYVDSYVMGRDLYNRGSALKRASEKFFEREQRTKYESETKILEIEFESSEKFNTEALIRDHGVEFYKKYVTPSTRKKIIIKSKGVK